MEERSSLIKQDMISQNIYEVLLWKWRD